VSVGKERQGASQPRGQWISNHRRLAIYLRDGFACVYCGEFLHTATPDRVTLDHLKTRASGGTNDSRNLVTACRTCNSARGSKPWRRFATPEAQTRVERFVRRQLNTTLAKAILDGRVGDPRIEAKDLPAVVPTLAERAS
jgi:5-methylcytosine-specific restriction endonuclease McrA